MYRHMNVRDCKMRKVRQSLGINKLHEKGIKGNDIGVAVLDSGITMHPDFK